MREQLKLRFAKIDEAKQILEWLGSTPSNEFDADILGHPSLKVLASYNGIGACAYLPMQNVCMLESVAVKPGLPLELAAQAFRDLVKGAELAAHSSGQREIYFLGTEENLGRMAENHGFERLPWPIYRMKL